ncbi:MAG: class I tRNA ligase family protein, partial [Bacteroidota bacterium]
TPSIPLLSQGLDGVYKFLRKFWQLFHNEAGDWIVNEDEPTPAELKILHTCIKKINEDIERFSFNTCVSAFMVVTNDLRKVKCHKRAILAALVPLIAPFAPFISEELWAKLGMYGSVHHGQFPVHNDDFLVEDSITYPISINGKKRATIEFAADAPKDEIEQVALSNEAILKWTTGKTVRKVIVVPKRMVNIVVG